MWQQSEPTRGDGATDDDPALIQTRLRQLFAEQPYAVLCTQGGGQPYGSLVAFVASDDLRHIVFATPSTTRKFRLLCECNRVALVIDSRSQGSADIMALEAVTATGQAQEMKSRAESAPWERLLVGRHPDLESFVLAPSSALFVVEISRYLHVARFQEVQEWVPANRF